MALVLNPATTKLALVFGIGLADATELVSAGFSNPRKVRDATDEQLGRVKGMDAGKLSNLRARRGRGRK